jgi:hypothetical protein
MEIVPVSFAHAVANGIVGVLSQETLMTLYEWDDDVDGCLS